MPRKTKYKSDFPKQAYKLAKAGLLRKDIAKKLGIGHDTFCTYLNKYPEFSEAIEKGERESDKYRVEQVENSLFRRATGYVVTDRSVEKENGKVVKAKITNKHINPSDTAAIFYLVNRAPHRWKSINKEQQDNNRPQTVDFTFNIVTERPDEG